MVADGREFEGRVALVTGGASGIGLATARRLASAGASVCLVDVADGRAAAEELGGRFVHGDVGEPATYDDAVRTCEETFGGLDVVHLNAGVTIVPPEEAAGTDTHDVTRLTDEQYRRIMRVNVDGVVFGTRAVVPALERRGGGDIVATASLAGLVAFPVDPVYSLTKHAVVGFVRSVADDLAKRGIRANCVCPGITATPLVGDEAVRTFGEVGFPLLEPEDIAEAVVGALRSGETGQAWACQPGREPVRYEFRGVPGPRTPGAEGRTPPPMRP